MRRAYLARSLLCYSDLRETMVREPDGEKTEISLLEDAINSYLVRHPFAADTIEGVCHWWLTECGINATPEKVLTALEKLVKAGLIEKSNMHDGREIYALAPRKH